ncbi:MAG: RdgB/HAM1 family non-canonical purine NTP pyrophosphatase [Halobacteriovoraceae bacterium]|nr:RdgB/HAM1 family non-canonical purine NTP pyrophosphatase [Halobacteriovoraceae bacterium]
MEILIASGNSNKIKEFKELLDDKIFKIISPSQKILVEETGDTFLENGQLKAQAYYEKFKLPVLSDDSGLVVEKLPHDLGVRSARFGGEGLNDKDRAELLLKKLEGMEKDDRKACFVCVLCFYLNPQEIFFFEGRLNGYIAHKASGDEGFGYDPVFLPENSKKTLASNPAWKKQHSHRAKACQKAAEFFASRIS